MKKRLSITLLIVSVLFVTACGRLLLSDKEIDAYSKMPYPRVVAVPVEDLDLVATQTHDHLSINNRTAHAYHNVDLWLNQEYVTHVNKIQIGEGGINDIPLGVFINKYSESYPVGGLLTPDRAFPVITVELFDPRTGRKFRCLTR